MCFHPYKVLSSRILRDDGGNGRGVGFARYVLKLSRLRRSLTHHQ